MSTPSLRDTEKSVDLPPFGPRNADPLTNAAGAHPIETGVGAALAGAASGVAIGMVAGPVGAAVGAAIGAVAGGLAGKGVGELIDPTVEDNWVRERFSNSPTPLETEIDEARAAYRFGVRTEAEHLGHRFDDVAEKLKSEWDGIGGPARWGRPWRAVKDEAKAGYDAARAARLRL